MKKLGMLSIMAGLLCTFGDSIPTDINGVRKSNSRGTKHTQLPEEAQAMLKKAELKRQRKAELKRQRKAN